MTTPKRLRAPAGLLAAARREVHQRRRRRVVVRAGALCLTVMAVAGYALRVEPEATPAIVLEYEGPAEEVALVGSLTAWEPLPMARTSGGVFRVRLTAQPGTHEYGFLVDGQWTPDPRASHHRDDGFGGVNAVLEI